MPRLAILGTVACLAILALATNSASAQESGGVALSPDVLQAQNAQGQVLDHVLARVQQLQQLRAFNLSGGGVTSSNLANPAAASPNSATQTPLGAADALSLASALRQRALQNSDPAFVQNNVLQQQFVDNSQSLTVNAPNSSVVLGSNNIVRQRVTSSTAISPTGNATASASTGNATAHHGTRKNKAQTDQSAVSTATSVGGTAQAVAINTTVTPQVSH